MLLAVSPRLPFLLWLGFGRAGARRHARGRCWPSRRRAADGRRAALPELASFVTGLALFHPYLWIPDSARATFAMLLPALRPVPGLVWLLHRRKFREPAGSPGPGRASSA